MDYPFWKRTEDVIGSTVGILVFLPLLPFVALAIKLENYRYPVFVRLPRVSEGRVVMIYKFNNMVLGADKMKKDLMHMNERADGPFFKIKNDPRVTRVGRVLRKFRIDELPQLINVLKGELALVGPRPHELEEVMRYPEEYKTVPLRRAGATGLSQVSGASSLPFLKELELDSEYLSKQSIKEDLRIIMRTAFILFSDPSAV